MFFKKQNKSNKDDLTGYEIKALDYEYDLTAAHTFQPQSATQEKIINKLSSLWFDAERRSQHIIEREFIESFYKLLHQQGALQGSPVLLNYSSSIAMVVIANYLKRKNMSVTLLEPCFDNIHDILSNLDIKVSVFKEEWLYSLTELEKTLQENVHSDALFLVDPNNPTGFSLFSHGKEGFEILIKFAKKHNKLLIIDFCFLPFLIAENKLAILDVHKMLEESGVSYIALSDTGKAWPTQDAKCGLLKVSSDIFDDIYAVHRAFLLNVSPFILNILIEYVRESQKNNFESLNSLLITNLSYLEQKLNSTILELQLGKIRTSVAWVRIKESNISAHQLQQEILKKSAYVLPGNNFFWKNPQNGDKYIRIALARDPKMFKEAIDIIAEVLKNKYETK